VKRPNGSFVTALGIGLLCLASAGVSRAAVVRQQPAPAVGPITGPPPEDNLARSGFDRFYNLDYERAIRDFENDLKAHPDDPFAVNHLLTARLFHELYRMGVLDTGYYSNNSFLSQPLRKPDPKEQAQIKQLINSALKLEDDRLEHDSRDVNTLYARGVTRGLRATYTALVERSWFAALRSALGARRDHQRVLELDPSYTDAKMVVGIHNYVVGSLPWGVKIAVAVVGIGGSKKKGIEYLYDVANCSSCLASTDSKVVLGLFLRREGRYPEALEIMRSLARGYARNVLFALEEPNILRAMGKNQEAETLYGKIFQEGKEGHFNGHYELAAYSLGELLRGQKSYQAAADAYNLVDTVRDADPEVQQRANLAAGEMYDLLKKRDLALKKYQTVIAEDSGTPPAESARKHIKQAYHAD
jgi:tetratricopeptide (TPR) repeat protein